MAWKALKADTILTGIGVTIAVLLGYNQARIWQTEGKSFMGELWGPVLILILAGSIVAAAVLRFKASRSAKRDSPLVIGAAQTSLVGQWGWLHKDAADDLGSKGGLVKLFHCEKGDVKLGNIQPYLDFVFWVYSGCIWPVALDRVNGRLSINGDELPPPELITNKSTRIPRSAEHHITIRQWLTRDVADRILAGGGTFNLHRVVLIFRINPDGIDGHPVGGTTGVALSHIQKFNFPS